MLLLRRCGSTTRTRSDSCRSVLKAGIELVGGTPAELTAMIKADMARMEKVVKESGLRE
jgi:tripartite-type tricarboxylate transporter receptor subunit TctC